MSRRVPEFALVIGVFLGLSALVFGLALGWGLLDTVVLAALGTYPFVAFGLLRDDDPSSVVPAQWVLAGGVLWAVLGVGVVALGIARGDGLANWALAGIAVAFAPSLFVVLSRER